MQRNFKLLIEYDGTNYHGWQRQPNGPTIQQEIEAAIAIMTCQPVTLIGSGRTDAGVHARGQSANFKCDTRITAEAFAKGLNSLLPADIVIRKCSEVSLGFHARYDVVSKTYRYTIRNSHLPAAIGRQFEWWIRAPLDVAAMSAATGYLVGRRDFKAFEGAGSPRAHTMRQVMRADLLRHGRCHLRFEIQAQGFLRYMVRNIVGTLVDVGRGDISAMQIPDILDARERSRAGATAPAQGLCLLRVEYPAASRISY